MPIVLHGKSTKATIHLLQSVAAKIACLNLSLSKCLKTDAVLLCTMRLLLGWVLEILLCHFILCFVKSLKCQGSGGQGWPETSSAWRSSEQTHCSTLQSVVCQVLSWVKLQAWSIRIIISDAG